jgi:two-component system sensor histidine kinase CpxA
MRIPIPHLYMRMVLHIGAALAAFVLIGALSLGLIAAWELRGYIKTRHSSLGQEAAAVLAATGKTGLKNWLQTDAHIPDDATVYILDESSEDILGRELPQQYVNFVRNSVVGPQTPPESNYQPVRLAPQLISPDGARYAFLVLPKRISLLGSAATSIGVLLAALLVIASVAWLIARTFSKPISELQLAVQDLARGDTHARVPDSIAGRGDELGDLAAGFNLMADKLTGLIDGRESMLREMSHELRSPLARLHAAVALASQRNTLNATECERIEQEIGRMNRVIGEMLHYSSLDAAVAPKRRLVRIDRILASLVAVEEIEATNNGCRIQLQADSDLTVAGDPELLNSAFENILRNAIRYAPRDSIIEITAQRYASSTSHSGPGNIVIKMRDCGPGVPVQDLERIFEPYARVSTGNHSPDSTGLGLAIVKRVVEQHGGHVRARNRSSGGLSVTVQLPAADLS